MALLFCACGSDNTKKAVEDAAYHYLDAMGNYRVDDAEPYCTKETQDGVLEYSRQLIQVVRPGYIESDTPASITISNIDITSDTTAVVCYRKVTPIKDQEGNVDLVKRGDRWLVHRVIHLMDSNNSNLPSYVHGEINNREIVGFPNK